MKQAPVGEEIVTNGTTGGEISEDSGDDVVGKIYFYIYFMLKY